MAGDRSSGSTSALTTDTILGVKLYAAIGIAIGFLIFVCLVIILFILCNRRFRRRRVLAKSTSGLIPMIAKEIREVKALNQLETREEDIKEIIEKKKDDEKVIKIAIETVKSDVSGGSQSSSSTAAGKNVLIGWGRWYRLNELEIATGGFAVENVIGEGGYGVVYRGVLADGFVIAVKNLFNNRGQAEQEFTVEVEAIGKVRHKNLVGLIGYCVEGDQRMLIYEYVNNGNLEQWLHGDVGPLNPLTWDARMKIAIGTAKGLAYLHEGLEPKVVHRDVKSSNILLDKKWNPKVSDFGLAKLLGDDASYVTTRVMGTFGYVAPEYASSGRLNEGSDVYSFGILLMEIISGRRPVDYARPAGEVNLIDWFKMMISNRRGDEVLDPRIEIHPSQRALKRAFLVCLRCIDWNANKRPKMGQVVHMLEAEDFPYRVEHWSGQDKDSVRLSPNAAPVVSDGTPFLSRTMAGR